jgi:glucose-1-phosphatase
VHKYIKNIIFDLGGVILDLDVSQTLKSFSALAGLEVEKVRSIFVKSKEFEDYEKGMINDSEFRSFVSDVYHLNTTDERIDSCWNAMLRGIPPEKLKLLESLKVNFNVLLLSNTNNIHHTYINTVLMPRVEEGKILEHYFHKSYYSHRMLKRKPELEIYQQVLDENNFLPEHTLFLDDNASNVAGARAVGINAVFADTDNFILTYFK